MYTKSVFSIGAILFLSGCVDHTSTQDSDWHIKQPFAKSNVPVRQAEKLSIPASYDIREYVRCGQKEGELQLCEISSVSTREGAWCFLPDIDVWVQAAEKDLPLKSYMSDDRTVEETDTGVIVNEEYISHLAEYYSTIINYHSHPTQEETIQSTFSMMRRLGKRMNANYKIPEKEKNWIRSGTNVISMMPSAGDLAEAVKYSKLARRINSGFNLTFRLSSNLGITEYGLTPIGKHYLTSLNNDVRNEFIIAMYDGIKKIVNDRVKGKTEENEAIQQVVELLSNEYFFVKFTPVEELQRSVREFGEKQLSSQ